MIPTFIGRIVEWDADKGCGWIDSEGQRIFLHRREFSERRKRPEVGDAVRFRAGLGPTGLTCARDAVHLNDGGRFGGFALLLLLGLLILPVLAVARLPLDPRITGGSAVAANVIAYLAYVHDKARARARGWRISEGSLHLLELIGGWPAAFIAQRRLRHKCSRRSYQVVFWMIVVLHEYVAFDFLQDGRLSSVLIAALRSAAG